VKERAFTESISRKDSSMRNLLALVGLATVTFLGLGWYLGWYQFASTTDPNSVFTLRIEDIGPPSHDKKLIFIFVGARITFFIRSKAFLAFFSNSSIIKGFNG